MVERIRTAVQRLRATLNALIEKAYKDRDESKAGSYADGYARGEAYAYTRAEDEARKVGEQN